MKKVIDGENYEIYYYGNVDELKIQLKNFSDSLGIHLDEEINKLEKITNSSENISTLFERIYYNSSRLYFRVNSSDKRIQKNHFEIIKKRTEKLDEIFIKKNQDYEIQTESLKKD
jgi:hypothetical protein